MNERIDKYINKSSVIKIYTEVEGDENGFYGIPVRRSNSLLAFHQLADFHFDGYRIVRLKDIVRIRRSRFDTISQKILKATGELENHVNPGWLRIGSWKSLLSSIKSKGLCAGVESGLIKVNVFALGEIFSLNDKAVTLKSFDANGDWYKPKQKLKYSTITEVTFGDEYGVTFNEFIKNR